MDWDALGPDDAVPGELLVGFKPDQSRAHMMPLGYRGKSFDTAAADRAHRTVGATVRHSFRSIPCQHVALPPGQSAKAAAARYLADPSVEYVEPNYIVHALETYPNDARYGELWGMERINAPAAWDTTTGSTNIVVGVIDTGIRMSHEDLAQNIWTNPGEIPGNGLDDDNNGYVDDVHGWDFYANDNDPTDERGHGTHVAGTIGGIGNNGKGVAGVNWKVRLMPLRFLGPYGGETSDAILAIEYAAMFPEVKLTNNSWGGGPYDPALQDAIEASGRLFVAAAGNDNSDNDGYPAFPASYDSPNIISVASITSDGVFSDFSNYGRESVDIAAPGSDILSCAISADSAYVVLNGTSMACPHVAGAAALLWSEGPDATWQEIRDAILSTAAFNEELQDWVATDGELDLGAAIKLVGVRVMLDRLAYRSDALVGITVRDPATQPPTNDVPVSWQTTTNGLAGVRAEGGVTNTRVDDSSSFFGSLQLASGVTAVNGDLLTVSYVAPGGRTASSSAPIDDVPPVIIELSVAEVWDDTAVIRWYTDEPADTWARCSDVLPLAGVRPVGTSEISTDVRIVGGATQYVHEVTFTGLLPARLYYVAVSSTDLAGNVGSEPVDLASTDPNDYRALVTRLRRTVFFDDLERGTGEWTTSSLFPAGCWEYGEPVFGPEAAYSGDFCWGTVLDGRYPETENAWVQGESIRLDEHPRLEFWTWFSLTFTRSGFGGFLDIDLGFVEVNDGSGWVNVTGRLNLQESVAAAPRGTGLSGYSDGWQLASVELPEFAGKQVQVRFRLSSENPRGRRVNAGAGWFVDDVKLTHFRHTGVELIEYAVHDGSPGGDGDGVPEPGETFVMDLSFLNTDPVTYTGLQGSFESSDPGVTLGGGGVIHLSYGTAKSGGLVHSGNEILVTIGQGIDEANFQHAMTAANGGPWIETITLPIERRETIEGRVTAVTGGAAIEGATVAGTAAGYPDLTALTGASGSYLLSGCVPGVLYSLTASKPGAYSESDPVERAGPATGVNFALGRAFLNPAPTNLLITVAQDGVASTNLLLDNAAGDIALSYSVEIEYLGDDTGEEWLTVLPLDGTAPAGGTASLAVTASGTNLFSGTYEAVIHLEGNDASGAGVDVPVTMSVEPAPLLHVAEVIVQGGDGDPYPEPGETVDLNIVLGNWGDAVAFGVTGTVTVLTNMVTVVQPVASWSSVWPFDAVSPDVLPTITVHGLPDNATLPFRLDVTDSDGRAWPLRFDLVVDVRYALSGTVTPCGAPGTPVEGARVRAQGDTSFGEARTGADGQYTILGLVPGAYRVIVTPPAPYASPESRAISVSDDLSGVDFCVADWLLEVDPESITMEVDEGVEANETLQVSNGGSIAGHVEVSVNLVSGIPERRIGDFQMPQGDWTALEEGMYMPGQLLVRFRDGVDVQAREQTVQAAGARELQRFHLVPSSLVAFEAGPSMAAVATALSADPNVLYVTPNYLRFPTREPNDVNFDLMANLLNERQTGGTLGADIRAAEAWDTTVGSGDVVVGIVDTGIERTHPDLVDNIWRNLGEGWSNGVAVTNGIDDDGNGYVDDHYGWDSGCKDRETSPDYTNGMATGVEHGTHVAGTVGAVGDNGIGVVGVNWDVSLMAVKATTNVFGFFGVVPVFPVSAVVGAIEYLLTNNVPISNHSYGGPLFSPLEWEYVGKAYEHGHLMICAAGNDAQDNDLYDAYPANYGRENGGWPNVISVAASDADDLLAEFSNYGDHDVDIAAPGVGILSTVSFSGDLGLSHWYESMDGTSMASPHVAGVCALLKALSPAATWDMLKTAVAEGARFNPVLDGWVEAGRQLDAAGALEVLRTFWIQVDPVSFDLAGGHSATVNVTLNAGGRLPNGVYEADIAVSQGAQAVNVPVMLMVNPAPVPVLVGLTVDDSAAGGDDDGYAEPGETVDLVIRLRNDGSDDLVNPTGVLTTATPGVTVSVQPAWGFIFSEGEGDPVTPARVTIGGGVSGPVTFRLQVLDGFHTPWTLSFDLDVARWHSIRGRVTDRDSGEGLAGATVECWGAGGGSAVTDIGGYYGLHGLYNGSYRVRAIPLDHEKSAPVAATLSGGDVLRDFALRLVAVTFTPAAVSAVEQQEQTTVTNIAIRNTASAAFDFTVYEMPRRRVALISDGAQLTGVAPVLSAMGFETDSYTNNFDYVPVFSFFYQAYTIVPTVEYSDDLAVLLNYDLVIADLSGKRSEGRKLQSSEFWAFDEFLWRGGTLIVTGVNPLSLPDDPDLAYLVWADSLDRAAGATSDAVVEAELPSEIFVDLAVGDRLAVQPLVYDLATPGEDATAYVTSGEATKVMASPYYDGTVYLWSGNDAGADWTGRGVWQDLFKNILMTELAEDVSWLSVAPEAGSVSGGTAPLTVTLDAAGLSEGLHRATLLIKGNYPGADARFVQVDFDVVIPSLRGLSSTGVVDWLGDSLSGDGTYGSSLFQLIWAGPDGRIDPPVAGGGTTGDDAILRTYPEGVKYGRFGVGYPDAPDTGRFSDVFRHNLTPAAPAKSVYVRAWDGPTFGSSVAFGDSETYTMALEPNEAHDFGFWVVDQSPGYPGPMGVSPDANGDTVPDGWALGLGLDPRDPIAPLGSRAETLWTFGEAGQAGALSEPRKIFRAGNLVFVLDKGSNSVKVWNEVTRTFLLSYTPTYPFSQPEGMGKDPNANRFAVADTQNDRIQVFTFNPVTGAIAYERKFGTVGSGNGQLNDPKGVAISPLGLFFVADTTNNRIEVFGATGTYQYQFGGAGSTYGKFNKPEGIAVSSMRYVYVADTRNHRIQMFTSSGGNLGMKQFGKATVNPYNPQPGEFWLPKDVQIGLNNRIVVADTGNKRVQVFDGASIWAAPHILSIGPSAGLVEPYGVWPVEGTSLVYVTDASPSRVVKFNMILDADGDGMDDTWEFLNGLDSSDPSDATQDADGDGIWSIGEFRIGTDPLDPDSDDDGELDGREIALGFSPLDPAQHPSPAPDMDPPAIAAFEVGNAVLVRYTVQAGKTYKVQSTTNLLDDLWMDEPGSTVTAGADGTVDFFDVPGEEQTVKFYRAVGIVQ